MHDEHLVNVFGACALAVADLIASSVTEQTHTSRSGAAALAVLVQAGPLNVTELGRRVGLSQPAAARMVESMEQAGVVSRRRSAQRAVAVVLTQRGRRAARHVLSSRSARLEQLLDGLSAAERETLAALLSKVAANVYVQAPDADLICRLCDRQGCVRNHLRCPVGVAAGEDADA
jgi:MarR family transcriptional regulator, negative regulator of the multidrug operon emrRAB